MSRSHRHLQVRANCFSVAVAELLCLLCLLGKKGWWTHCEHIELAMLCVWASQETNVFKGPVKQGDVIYGDLAFVLLVSSGRSLLAIPCGGGLWLWHAPLEGCHPPKVSFESLLGARQPPSIHSSLYCDSLVPLRILWRPVFLCFYLFLLLLLLKCKLKWGEKNITLLQVLTFFKITSIQIY